MPAEDARRDASVDAMADAAGTDGVPGPDGPPGPLDGEWSVTWSCVQGCTGLLPRPGLTYSHALTVTSASLHWYDDTCGDCIRDHIGAARANCVDVPAGIDSIDDRAAYSVCTTGPSSATTTISVRRVGGSSEVTTWQATAARR